MRTRAARVAMLVVWVTCIESVFFAGTAQSEPTEPNANEPNKNAVEQAKEEFRRGVTFFEANDTELALEYFKRSRALFASRKNTLNMAVCLERLGRFDEALELYEDMLARFSKELTDQDRIDMPNNVARFRALVGEIEVSSNNPGTLFIDGVKRGQLPLTVPLRVMPGKRKLRIVQDGYSSFERELQVEQGKRILVEAKTEQLTSAGVLQIDTTTLVGADLLIDGQIQGQLPWSGVLPPGAHIVQAIGSDRGTGLQSITVLQGQTTLMNLTARALTPPIRIESTPASATIKINSIQVGSGVWAGRLAEGDYTIEVSEPGYRTAVRSVNFPKSTETTMRFALDIDKSHPRWPKAASIHLTTTATFGLAFGKSLGSGAENNCGDRCSQSIAFGQTAMLTGAIVFPQNTAVEISAGFLTAGSTVNRQFDRLIPNAPQLPLTYSVHSEPRISGPFFGLGISHSFRLGGQTLIRPGATFGLLLANTHDDTTVTVHANGESTLGIIDRPNNTIRTTPWLIMPRVELERSWGNFGFVGALSLLLITSSSERYDRETVSVSPNCSPTAPQAVGCAPTISLFHGEKAHGTMALVSPYVGLRYLIR